MICPRSHISPTHCTSDSSNPKAWTTNPRTTKLAENFLSTVGPWKKLRERFLHAKYRWRVSRDLFFSSPLLLDITNQIVNLSLHFLSETCLKARGMGWSDTTSFLPGATVWVTFDSFVIIADASTFHGSISGQSSQASKPWGTHAWQPPSWSPIIPCHLNCEGSRSTPIRAFMRRRLWCLTLQKGKERAGCFGGGD